MFGIDSAAIAALIGVILIDVVLSGDNAVIIGQVAAGLPPAQRQKAIYFGMGLALLARLIMSAFAVVLLNIPGLQLIGGLLLCYVAWGMYKELRGSGDEDHMAAAPTFGAAIIAISIADVSMSLDNVLAVAGTAKDHFGILVFGLILSIGLMVVGATLVAKLLEKFKWLGWVGLALVIFVAGRMIFHGYHEVPAMIAGVQSWFA